MANPIAWLRDLDGTGSYHACSRGDPESFPVYPSLDDTELFYALDNLLIEIEVMKNLLGNASDLKGLEPEILAAEAAMFNARRG